MRSVDDYVETIQPIIKYCHYDQPYDSEENDGIFWINGQKEWLEDIFEVYKVPDRLRNEVAQRLVCKNCGRTLERYEDVGVKTQIDYQVEKKWEEWNKRISPKFTEFGEYISRYPYLGLSHRIGKELYRRLKGFKTLKIDTSEWYRARTVEGSTILTSEDIQPPPQSPSEGRFNHTGQSFLYLCSEPVGAAIEVLHGKEGLFWLQKYQILDLENILDLTDYPSEEDEKSIIVLGVQYEKELLLKSPCYDNYWKPEYIVPRFIADCARQQGYCGILFYSEKHAGKNLVIFNWQKLISEGGVLLKKNPRHFHFTLIENELKSFADLALRFDNPKRIEGKIE